MSINHSSAYLIGTAIGLQDVDHLSVSKYFLMKASEFIRDEISVDELEELIKKHYNLLPDSGNRTKEADLVASRVIRLLSDDSFSFTVDQLLFIHRILFDGLLYHPGELRKYNFTKSEWILDGDTVTYGDYRELKATLQYDFSVEKDFQYKDLPINKIIDHLAVFIANLWQIHVFEEGNTRTIAVFIIKYLRSLGFNVDNDVFQKNAWYFRNALVRANYNDFTKSVFEDRNYLVMFLRNLLLGEDNELHNRELHIYYKKHHEQGV